ncbi:MAG: proteobacterial dedicated sortase system histidine kinase [Gammaproteobacteria bacterium]
MRSEKKHFKFTIRAKLFLLSIAVLIIPYIGYEYLRELESYLRTSLEASLVDATRALSGPMHENYRLFPYTDATADDALFIHTLTYPIQLDGYTDDWINYLDWSNTYSTQLDDSMGQGGESLSYKLMLGQYQNYLYVMIQVQDDQVIYQQPSGNKAVDGDHIEFVIADDYEVKQRYYFSTSAPGRFNPFQVEKNTDELEDREYIRHITNIAAEWQQTEKGYNLEISIPMYLLDKHMGFVVADTDNENTRLINQTIGTAGQETSEHPGRLLRPSAEIEQIIKRLETTEGRRVWVLDHQGQVLASSGSLIGDFSRHPLNLVYSLILPSVSKRFQDDLAGASRLQGQEVLAALDGTTGSRWRLSPDQKAVIVSAATPVWVNDEVRGVVVVEQTTNNIQMLQRHALVGLFNKTLVVFLAITVLLLLFASRLSIRLRRLSNEADAAIDEYGRVTGSIKASKASDEIGDLSRNYSAMLDRLKQYNSYLEGLASKLSHELRTPMAVVQSSLDNLQMEPRGDDQQYLERAEEGIHRLNLLVTRLSESARLEQALQTAELEEIDLRELLSRCVEGYQLAYQGTDFILDIQEKIFKKNISADLFVQMLDKVIANAVDFSSEGKPVRVNLIEQDENIEIKITNYGSRLPKEMEEQLFNSMVSLRDNTKEDDTHLGLGLYIARMIAEHHGGHIKAENLDDENGVCFKFVFEK